MKKTAFLCLLMMLCHLSANTDLKEYKFVRSAKSDGSKSDTLAIMFDNSLYKNTNNDYSNIFITDADGGKVPFAVRDLTVRGGDSHIVQITDLKRNIKNNTAEITVKLPVETTINNLTFSKDLKRFDKSLDIIFYDCNDKIIRTDKNLKLYQYDKLYGNSTVKFKRIKTAKLSIIIRNFIEKKELTFSTETVSNDTKTVQKNVHTEEFKIKQITVHDDTEGKRLYHPVQLETIRTESGNNTVFVIDSCRIPFEYLTVKADDKHYARTVQIEFIDKNGQTQFTHFTQIFNNHSRLLLNGKRADKIRMTIFNDDNAPLKNVSLNWEAPQKIILAESCGNKDLKIYYGGNAEAKIYDIEKYADKLVFEKHSFYTLNKEEISEIYAPEMPKDKIYKYIMWAVLGAAALLLGAVIIKLMLAPPAEQNS